MSGTMPLSMMKEDTMKAVAAVYEVQVKCLEAVGSRKADVIGGTATVQLKAETTTQTLLTGSGEVKLTGTLTGLKSPKGEDMMSKLPGKERTMTAGTCSLIAGRLKCSMALDGVDIELSCYLDAEGARLTYGDVRATVKTFLWRFFIKEVVAEFSGTMISKEVSGV